MSCDPSIAPPESPESLAATLQRLRKEAEENSLKLSTVYPHSRDVHILFDEAPHKYYIKGKTQNWISVTSVISEFFEKFDATGNASRIARHPEFWTRSSYRKYHAICEELGAECPETREAAILVAWDRNRDEASALGTDLHRCIELFYNGVDPQTHPSTAGKVPEEYYVQFLAYHKANDLHLEPFRTEMMVWDEDLMVCGSVDMLFRSRADGEFHLRDWKRSKKINFWAFGGKRASAPVSHLKDTNFSKYCLQLNIYAEILRRRYSIDVKSMAIVVFHPTHKDKQAKEFLVPDMKSETKAIFDHHRRRVLSIREDTRGVTNA